MAKSIVLLMCHIHNLQPLSDSPFVHPSVHSSTELSTFTHQCTFTCLFVHSFGCLFIHSVVCSFIRLFIHSFMHACMHASIHPFITRHPFFMQPYNHQLAARPFRYTRGGLIEQAFYIQIANAILPELSDLLNPFTFLTSHVMAR